MENSNLMGKCLKRTALFLFMLLLCVFQVSCGKNGTDVTEEKNGYQIYYANTQNQLETKLYEPVEETPDLIYRELLNCVIENYKSNHFMNPNDDILELDEYIINGVYYVYFSESYGNLSHVDEVLFRAAVVKTLVQAEGIDYVCFYVNNQPLMTESGTMVGRMSSLDFITGTDEPDSVQWIEAKLYFSDSEGTGLVCEERSVAYSAATQIEQVVIEQLIDGPENSELKETLPKSLKVLGVSIKDGVCYVNFNEALTDSSVDIPSKLLIYSIVDTLCELNSVTSVQFLINGSSDVNFRENISFMTTFERNLDLIKETDTTR